MRSIVAYLASSVDGFIAGPGDDMDWLPRFEGDQTGFHDFFREVTAIAMGRRTYEWIGGHTTSWPYGEVPSYVLSTRLPEGRAGHVTVTPGPVRDLARTLRDGEGTAWLVGGGELFAAFAAAGQIDRWIVTVVPVLLGAGIPLFPARSGTSQRLELAESLALPEGLVQLHYTPAA